MSEFDEVKRRLMDQINNMNDAELRIVAKSRESLAFYISEAFHSIAKLLGYAIALPIGWAITAAESILDGLQEGLTRGYEAGRYRRGF
jgi:hypothetical protein